MGSIGSNKVGKAPDWWLSALDEVKVRSCDGLISLLLHPPSHVPSLFEEEELGSCPAAGGAPKIALAVHMQPYQTGIDRHLCWG